MRGQPDYPACTVFAKGLKVHVNPKFHYIFGRICKVFITTKQKLPLEFRNERVFL